MADRVERLTNLLALLLETPEPLSLVQIGSELASQYPEAQGARRTAFERDKAALREIGVPIEQEIVAGGPYAGQTRYWIDRKRYEMRDLDLDDDEMRALQVAMAATRRGSAFGQEALWKLGAGLLDQHAPVAAVVPDLPSLPVLRESVSARRPVSFSYRDLEREVDPWGLLLRNGFWYLVGFDHERGDRRTFRIDRIEGAVRRVAGRTFDRPDRFDPTDAFPDDPKMIAIEGGGDESSEALVLIDAMRASSVEREFGDRVRERRPGGDIVIAVPCANLPAFRSWLLGFLDHAEVLEPADVRADVVAFLESVAS